MVVYKISGTSCLKNRPKCRVLAHKSACNAELSDTAPSHYTVLGGRRATTLSRFLRYARETFWGGRTYNPTLTSENKD
jgi:hypothetical protein